MSKTAAYNQLPLWVNQYSSPQAWRTLAGAPPQRRLGSDARADRQPPLMPDPHILKNMPRLYFLKHLRRKVQRFQLKLSQPIYRWFSFRFRSKFHYWLAISKLPGNSIIEWQFSTGLALHASPVTVSLRMSVRLHPARGEVHSVPPIMLSTRMCYSVL